MNKTITIYLSAFAFSIIIWNLIIGNFIFNQSAVLFDNEIGNRHYPKTKFLSTKEGYAEFYTDELGFNNKKISIENEKKGKTRIIILGDSITEAAQVGIDKSYASLLNTYLNKFYDDYEVYNLGFSGRAIPDYISYAEGYINKFSPDYFIIQINYNDFISDAIKYSKQNYISEEDGKIGIINNTHAGNIKKILLYDKALWFQPIIAYTLNNISGIQFKNIFKKDIAQAKDGDIFFESADDKLTERDKKIIEWQVEKLFEKYGDKFALLYTDVIPFIDNGTIVESESDYIFTVKNELKKECEKFNIPFIDTKSSFLELYEESKRLPRGFDNSMPGSGHLNESGHKIVAEILYKFIRSKNL